MEVTVTYISWSSDLPYILQSFSCINTILSDYVLVWSEVWPPNKCRLHWPLFHSPVILSSILKKYFIYKHHTFRLSFSIARHFTANVGHSDLYMYFRVWWFYLKSWTVLSDYNLIWLKGWLQNKCSDLYFIVQWFCLEEYFMFIIILGMTRCLILKLL